MLPLTTKLTVSPTWVPVVDPVIVTLPPASAALRMLSALTSLTAMVGVGAVVSTTSSLLVVSVAVLPAASVSVAVTG